MVDPNSPEHVYEQVARILRERVADGTWTGRLPSEGDIAGELGVARNTVRRAVAALVDEEVLVVIRGRGVFVAKQ